MRGFSKKHHLSNCSDDFLLNEIKNQDQAAFTALYERYWKKLYHYAVNILRNEAMAEDVLQETFVSLWNKRLDLEITNLENYLITAVKNRSLNDLKKLKTTTLKENFDKEIFENPRIITQLEGEEIEKSIFENIKNLPERRRQIFLLSRYEKLTIQEISLKLNISPRTVENQLSLALKFLRYHLDKIAFLLSFVSNLFSKH